MSDALKNPAYSTSVGLLKLGLIMDLEDDRRRSLRRNGTRRRSWGVGKMLKGAFGRLLPEEEEDIP
jgi:hypothetical protein